MPIAQQPGFGFLKKSLSRTAGSLVLLFAVFGTAHSQTPSASAVASAHPIATQAGHEILAAGGNAFDAAIAISATLAVVEPTGSGMGGGGFWLLHRAADNFDVMIDGRERAPLAAHRDMYLDEQGDVIPNLSMNGPLAAGIPGQPAALVHLAKHYGKLSLEESLAPAIRAAREGFAVNNHYRRLAGFRLKAMQDDPETSRIFLRNKQVPELGQIIKQNDLANTLEIIAKQGHDGFYSGKTAQQLVDSVQTAGGIWSLKDLAEYKIVERTPIKGRYRGINITSAAPPSSGGIALITMLNILDGFELQELDETTRTHAFVEAMRRAYRDRAEYLGDPDFVNIPTERLTHPYYAEGLRKGIRLDKATSSDTLSGTNMPPAGTDTTHFSVLDQEGNRVSATLSINYPFGAAFTAPGTGVLLNDEMDDFSAKPDSPNAYGLVGAEANAIAPGKRPLSSMTPTFMESDDKLALLGTPGGSRIITMVLLAGLEFMDNKPVDSWVALPRFHHQFLPDLIQHEPGTFSSEQKQELQALGHELKDIKRTYGNMQAILWDKKNDHVSAASDPRNEGMANVFKH